MAGSSEAQEWKTKGNGFLKEQKFDDAIDCYTKALSLEENHVFYSNRSAAYLSKGDATNALKDGESCIKVNPDWAKGYGRKAAALHKLGDLRNALATYEKGIQHCGGPDKNPALMSALQALSKEAQGREVAMIFAPGYEARLKANPKTAAYLEDPQFMQMLNMVKMQPQLLQILLQQDQRFRDVLQVLTGQDFSHMASEESKKAATAEAEKRADEASRNRTHQSWAPQKKQKTEEELKKEADEVAAKKAAEAAAAADPTRVAAEKSKAEGNAAYKAKRFQEAIQFYEQACNEFPSDMAYRLNIAAALVALKQYEDAIVACDKALSVGKENHASFTMIAKAYGRKGTAFMKLNQYEEAIQCFQNSLLESADKNIDKKLKLAIKAKKKAEENAYLNPEEGKKAKERGNALFKEGNWKDAIAEYDDAIKRDPTNAVYFCNRGACFTKLMAFEPALKDVTKAISLDDKYVKAYGRKGAIEFFLKRYNQAMKTYRQGLEIDPNDATCSDGLQNTARKIQQMASTGTKEEREQQRAEAMKDPEIQALLRDPILQGVLEDMQKDPQKAAKHMRNPSIAEKIQKLIGAGIIGTA